MIHMLQCFCGPARHTIYGILYNDETVSPQEAREGIEALVEMQADHGIINRRCEICDAPIKQFMYEDSNTEEQDWDKAVEIAKRSEAAQTATRLAVQAARRAARN